MEITAALNLAIPIRWNDGGEPLVWAHHTPISREVFEANYRIISAAHMTLSSKGAAFAAEAGPVIGALALRDAARQDALENGLEIEDPAGALLSELRRLTTVIVPGAAGYECVPVDVALARKAIDLEDWQGAESAIAFFTCGSWMVRRDLREKRRLALALVLRGSMTSSVPTVFAASLPMSTTAATSAASEPSSVPS